MLLQHKEVAILGAGPVGLTMARLLQQEGVDVKVYERDPNAQTRIWGGTLDLHQGSGQDALKKAGLLERYYAMALPMGRTIADEQGNVLFAKQPTPQEQYNNPEINRNDLRTLLLDSLAGDTVIWDRKCTGLEAHEGKWLLHFEHGRTATADLVIGANGGMSNARKQVTDAEVAYTGTFMLQGEVANPQINCPAFYQRCNDNILMASYQGNLLVANPKNKDLLTYNVIFSMPEEWVHDHELDVQHTGHTASFLSARFMDWGECYKELFHATTAFWGLPTRKLPLDQPWKNNRPLPITLIGDAAHLMPPFAGQGVNTGLIDALLLSNNLTNEKFETIAAAINDYEQKMLVYAAAAQLETSRNEIAMRHPDFSFQKMIR